MASDLLDTKSKEFADQLTELLQASIEHAPAFEVVATRGGRCHIGPKPWNSEAKGFEFIPLIRECDNGRPAKLSLKIEFTVSLDDQGRYLTVQQSAYGLWIILRRKSQPVLRIEYTRDAARYDRPLAHAHFHAESSRLGWIYGTAGLVVPRMDKIHFPLGGRRFRPTVEEFLKFLNSEKLFVDWLPGWDKKLDESLRGWETIQAKATVRRYPEAAVKQLNNMGYKVTPPD